MGYDYRYINRQVFPNSVGYTLLLEDTDGDGEEAVRIEKCFMVDVNLIDEEFLRNEAKAEIKRILTPPAEEIVEVPPEDAPSEE